MSEAAPEHSFSLRSDLVCRHAEMSTEESPILVIDNFLEQADWLVNVYAAEQANFGPGRFNYPGLNAEVPAGYTKFVIDAIGSLLIDIFAAKPGKVWARDTSLGLSTTAPEKLTFKQRIPHFDSENYKVIACVHYLCGSPHGGTAFYRHKESRKDSMSPDVKEQILNQIHRDIEENGELPARYPGNEHRLFDWLGSVDCVFNRLIMYRANRFHAITAPKADYLTLDPRLGRLTANLVLVTE